MIESVSCNELYEKFHELYIAVIKHIISKITLSRTDGVTVDEETLHHVQECCLAAFDELNRAKYEDALNNTPYAERSVLAVLTYTISSKDDDKFLPFIQETYKAVLPGEEYNMLGELFEIVSEQLYGLLSLSCKFLVATHDIEL
jgi:hypothetical protein